jgi:hypothetical protein
MYNEPTFESYDYAIGGKLVVARVNIRDSLIEDGLLTKKEIKEKLAIQVCQYMLDNNMFEFTQMQNPMDFSRTIACRAYVAPNDQVKILRTARKL